MKGHVSALLVQFERDQREFGFCLCGLSLAALALFRPRSDVQGLEGAGGEERRRRRQEEGRGRRRGEGGPTQLDVIQFTIFTVSPSSSVHYQLIRLVLALCTELWATTTLSNIRSNFARIRSLEPIGNYWPGTLQCIVYTSRGYNYDSLIGT